MDKVNTKLNNFLSEYKPLIEESHNKLKIIEKEILERFHQLFENIENNDNLRKRDKSDNLQEFNNITKKLISINENDESLAAALSNIGEMVACVVEAIKIQQALDNKDEEDKKGISL